MARFSGFSQAAVLAYVLAGIRPALSPVTIETQTFSVEPLGGVATSRQQLVLRFNQLELTNDHWKAIRRGVRAMRRHRFKALTEEDWIVYKIVENLGGVPETKPVRFWNLVRDECEKEGLAFKNYRGPRIRYERLRERLDASGIGDLWTIPDGGAS